MKATGIIVLFISLIISAVIALKEKKVSGKKITISELPTEVKTELDNVKIQADKRHEEGLKHEE